MSGPLPSDIQPVANETRDRIITGLVTLIPFVALGLAGWQVWGEALHWSDVFLFLGHLPADRARDHGRLPPPPHPPRLQDQAAGCTACWRSSARRRSRARSSPGSPTTASTTPSPTKRGTRTAPTSITAHGWSGALRGLFHAHMGWLFIHTQRGNKERFAPDLIKDPIDQLGRPHLHLLGDSRPAAPVRARLRDRRHPRRGSHRPALGRPGPGLRPAPLHLQHQLALPRLRQPRLRDHRRVAQPRPDRDPDLRRGLAQQPPRLPDLGDPRPRPLAVRPLRRRHRLPRAASASSGTWFASVPSAWPLRPSDQADQGRRSAAW